MINKIFQEINNDILDIQMNKIDNNNYDYLKLFIIIILFIIIYKK
jgi:hypothetical protein